MNMTEDRRRSGPAVQPPGTLRDADLVTREEAAELAHVTVRTITRWARDGFVTKYADARGRVRFHRAQVLAMNEFGEEPV